MKILIVGVGSIGARHASNLRRLVAGAELLVAEPDPGRRERIGGSGFETLEAALEARPELAVIASPTALHVEQARAAIEAGCHVLIEKPVSHRLDGIADLERRARELGRVVVVASNFRFDAGLARMAGWIREGAIGRPVSALATYGQYLPSCRPGSDHRLVYSARPEMGGGLLLEAVHEIDYLRWMFGEVRAVAAMTARLGDLGIESEDAANLLLRFRSGLLGQVHLDFLRRSYHRSLEVVGTEGSAEWVLESHLARCHSAARGLWLTDAPVAAPDLNAMYVGQLEHWLDCIAGRSEPLQGLAEACATLRVALAARRAAETGREVSPVGATVIVQARMGSRRLPGKVLRAIGPKTMLERVLDRAARARSVERVVVATTLESPDDQVERVARGSGCAVFRGSTEDVLDRYYRAALEFQAEVVVRITADCPLVDPDLIDSAVELLESSGADYASNARPRSSFPDGCDVEAFRFGALERAWREAQLASEREHVTPYIWKNPELFRLASFEAPAGFSQVRLTVDRPADLEFMERLFEQVPAQRMGWRELAEHILGSGGQAPENQGIPRDEGYARSVAADRNL